MNIAFLLISLASLAVLTLLSPSTAFSTMIQGVSGAILLIIKLTAIYSVWLSVLKMMQGVGVDKGLSRLLKPFVKRLFKKENDETYNWICVNLASNMLGMGGVATPAGIRAINAMNCDGEKASDNMILLLVINATSIQLIPSTVIAIRATAGSQNPSSIFLPTLISSTFATVCGVIMCKVLSLKNDDKKDNSTNTTHTLLFQNNKLNSILCKHNHKTARSKHYR